MWNTSIQKIGYDNYNVFLNRFCHFFTKKIGSVKLLFSFGGGGIFVQFRIIDHDYPNYERIRMLPISFILKNK